MCDVEEILEYNPDATIYPQFEEFYLGMVRRFNSYFPAYDYHQVIAQLKQTDSINQFDDFVKSEAVFVMSLPNIETATAIGFNNFYKPDGFEESFIGLVMGYGTRPTHGLFSYEKCVRIMTDNMTEDQLGEDEDRRSIAIEYLEYNTLGGWFGEKYTPFFFLEPEESGITN